jgi:hypothetical protein
MLIITSKQSEESWNLATPRSSARTRASDDAIASSVAGSEISFIVLVEAP